jgi:hypothetical protein
LLRQTPEPTRIVGDNVDEVIDPRPMRHFERRTRVPVRQVNSGGSRFEE